MTTNSPPKGLVEWQPEWKGDDLEYFNEVHKKFVADPSIIRSLRLKLSLSQTDIAEILGTTQSNVSKIEAKVDPKLSVISKIIESRGGKLRLIAEFDEGRQIELTQ